MPPLNRKALDKACRRVGHNTMWNYPNPKGISDIITSEEIEEVIVRYLKCAHDMAKAVEEFGGDPNLVVRAIDYLADQHAMPPMRDDVRWFQERLEAIAQLACPQLSGAIPVYHPIHDDILLAIASSKKRKA